MEFETLKKKFDETQAFITKFSDAFPWEDRAAYVSWLGQSYEYVNSVTRILALTAGHFPFSQTAHSNRFVQHAAEEKNHDRLLINDAKALGLDIAAIPVLPEAEAFHKSLYYWIYRGRPTVIFGWALFLECFAVNNGRKIFERVERVHGKKAASFAYVHSQDDIDHTEKGFETLRQMTAPELDEVAHGLELYAQLYANVYSAITARAGERLRQAA